MRLEDKPQDSVLSYHVGEMLLSGTPPAEHDTALGSVSRATHRKLKQTKTSLEPVPNTHTPRFSKQVQGRIRALLNWRFLKRIMKLQDYRAQGMFDGL